jgi:uncharacterized protein YqgC (DUF456 family)
LEFDPWDFASLHIGTGDGLMIYAWAALLVLVVIAAWSLNLFGLPGNWLIVLAALIYVALTPEEGRAAMSWPVVAALLGLALLGELIEFFASALGVARLGGSRRGAVLTLLGSIMGAITGAVIGVPIPVVGQIIAALFFGSLGALIGAMFGEQWAGRELGHSWRIGKAAFWGRLFGTLGKILAGSLMVLLVVVAVAF